MPPCTNWTGLGQYPGPVQWAGSFETIQRAGGLEVAGEARETLYLLAIDGQQPRLSRWQLDFRFGEATTPSEREPAPAAALEPPPPPVPEPLCDFDHENDPAKWFNCWYQLASPPDCYAWTGESSWPGDPEWTGECIDGLASGSGTLIANGWSPYTEEDRKRESTAAFRAGKKHGPWLDVRVDGLRKEGPYVNGQWQGRWISYGFDDDDSRSRLIEIYKDDERIDYWRP